MSGLRHGKHAKQKEQEKADVDETSAFSTKENNHTNTQEYIMTQTDQDCYIELIEQLIARQDQQDEIMTRLRAEIADLKRRLPTEFMEGTFPPYHEITQVACQIFHSPNLTTDQRNNKSVWSPRFTIWRNDKRMEEELSVFMFGQHGLRNMLMEREKLIPPRVLAFALRLSDVENLNTDFHLIGSIMRGHPPGRGRPYLPSQGVVIEQFESDNPTVKVWIDDQVLNFGPVRPAKGTRNGKAKWYCEWRPELVMNEF
jgi:hypothetical protein